MMDSSTEFGHSGGLGLLPGSVLPLREMVSRVPHTGWSEVVPVSKTSLSDAMRGSRQWMYFSHSFFLSPQGPTDVLALTRVESFDIPSAVGYRNCMALQFHPEKSGPKGLELLGRLLAVSSDWAKS